MTGTIRSFTPENRQLLQEELRRACSVVEPLGGHFDLHIRTGYPPLINSPATSEVMISATRDLLGEGQVLEAEKIMAAEDFSLMAREVPGCFLRVGVHSPSWEQYYFVHTPTFRLDEDALPIGTASLVATALAWMLQHR